MQNDVHDLPSDNSEDDDFDPYISEEYVADHVVGSSKEDGGEGLYSGESNFITSSDNNSEHVREKDNDDDLGLLFEDSKDDDYFPEDPDQIKISKRRKMSQTSQWTLKGRMGKKVKRVIVRQMNEFTIQNVSTKLA